MEGDKEYVKGVELKVFQTALRNLMSEIDRLEKELKEERRKNKILRNKSKSSINSD